MTEIEYIKQLEGLVTGNKMDFLQMAIKMPDAISTEREDIDESEWADIQNEILNALAANSLLKDSSILPDPSLSFDKK